jgi:hypothetical protein
MPTYCYKTKTGVVLEKVFPVGKQPKELKLGGGKVAFRDFASERVGVPPTKGWPIECIGSGVNASQAGDLRQHLMDKGVPTEVTSDGNPIYRNSKHRRKALKARGLCDKSAFM